MAVLCGMLTIQYSARSARLSVYKLFTSCIPRGVVWVSVSPAGWFTTRSIIRECTSVNTVITSITIWLLAIPITGSRNIARLPHGLVDSLCVRLFHHDRISWILELAVCNDVTFDVVEFISLDRTLLDRRQIYVRMNSKNTTSHSDSR